MYKSFVHLFKGGRFRKGRALRRIPKGSALGRFSVRRTSPPECEIPMLSHGQQSTEKCGALRGYRLVIQNIIFSNKPNCPKGQTISLIYYSINLK